MPLFSTLAILTMLRQEPPVGSFTQPIKDISFSMDVKKGNQPALRKISKDFADAYRFDHVEFKIKDSFQFHGETKSDDMSVLMIINEGIRVLRIPRQNLNIKSDVRAKPGQRQTIFEFGLLTPELFTDYMTFASISLGDASGNQVLDVRFNPRFGDSTRFRIWVDGSKKFTTKKEWYGQDGKLRATFVFSQPQHIGSFWVPTVVTVWNAEGTVAGVLNYSHFKINSGLDDALFKY